MMEVEVYKKRGEHWKEGLEKRERKSDERTLREESEQYYFLYRLSLHGRTCGELNSHLFLNIHLIFPSFCPRAKPFVVRSLLQILLIWVKVERHDPLLYVGLSHLFFGSL